MVYFTHVSKHICSYILFSPNFNKALQVMFPLNSLQLLWVLLKSVHSKLYCNQTLKVDTALLFVFFPPPYVYWTMHHLDSWIKRDQLDVTCFIISLFNAQHVSDVITSILRSLRLICWVIWWVVLLCFSVGSCHVVVCLWWCVFPMRAESLVH